MELKKFAQPPESLWLASTPETSYPALTQDIQADVAIVGGGFCGIACAYQLAAEGIGVVVLEANHILQGTTGHTTAKITSQHGLIYSKIGNTMGEELAKQYAQANEAAIGIIEKLSKELHIDCDFVRQPAYIYTQQEHYIQQIQEETAFASSLGIKAFYKEEIPFSLPIKGAVCFENQAQFHPRKFLLGLAKAAVDKGCSIYEKTTVLDIEENEKYVLTTRDGKKVTADRVIIASHYPFYNKAKLYFARLYPERSYITAIKAKEAYPGGMYISAEDPGRSLRSASSDQGELILVGGEHHKTGQGIDTIKHYEALVDFASQLFTVESVPYRWSAQDCMTLDGVPYIGQFTADTPNLYIATGFGKWGMTTSIVSSMLLKELILTGRSPYAEVFNPSRMTLGASAAEFLKENLNVAKEFIKGKLTTPPYNVEILPGEGKVVEADGQRTGAYRDEEGNLHLVNTTCTHLGCELQWNSAERSWDCPCHGSRFTYDGDVIEGPAALPLRAGNDVNIVEKVLKDDF